MSAEQLTVSEEKHLLPGLDGRVEDLIFWETLFRKNLPIPTEEGELIKFKSALGKFSTLVRRAMAGRGKMENLEKIIGNNDLSDFILSDEEQSAMNSMQSLIPDTDITPQLLRLETGIEAYLGGLLPEPDDRNLIFFTVYRMRIKTMLKDPLIRPFPETSQQKSTTEK